jgi:hypothetical protein
MRFQRDVKTLALKDINITSDLLDRIKTGMTRASMYMHDDPMGGGVAIPDRAQIEADVALLDAFEKETRS